MEPYKIREIRMKNNHTESVEIQTIIINLKKNTTWWIVEQKFNTTQQIIKLENTSEEITQNVGQGAKDGKHKEEIKESGTLQ